MAAATGTKAPVPAASEVAVTANNVFKNMIVWRKRELKKIGFAFIKLSSYKNAPNKNE
ncbi:MAG: hypothetical protein AAFV72_22790 [Cyanobacteria bacterium J06635_1]